MNANGNAKTYVMAEAADILGRMELAVAAMRSAGDASPRADHRAAARRSGFARGAWAALNAAPALVLAAVSLDVALFALMP